MASRAPALLWVVAGIVALAVVAVIAVPVWAGFAQVAAAPRPVWTATAAPDEQTATARPSAPASVSPTTVPSPSREETAARTSLEALASSTSESTADYDRALFGQAWYDQDRNGCDTRNDILRRDLTSTVIKTGTNGCKVLSGTLTDPYTGDLIEFVSGTDTSVLVQIDHLVPLAWAWRHGADLWDDAARTAFSNDPANLKATEGSVNQSKSDSGPADWMPPATAAHCAYAQDYIAVLEQWRLSVGEDDRRALSAALDSC